MIAVLFCLADREHFLYAVGFFAFGFFAGWLTREM